MWVGKTQDNSSAFPNGHELSQLCFSTQDKDWAIVKPCSCPTFTGTNTAIGHEQEQRLPFPICYKLGCRKKLPPPSPPPDTVSCYTVCNQESRAAASPFCRAFKQETKSLLWLWYHFINAHQPFKGSAQYSAILKIKIKRNSKYAEVWSFLPAVISVIWQLPERRF